MTKEKKSIGELLEELALDPKEMDPELAPDEEPEEEFEI